MHVCSIHQAFTGVMLYRISTVKIYKVCDVLNQYIVAIMHLDDCFLLLFVQT